MSLGYSGKPIRGYLQTPFGRCLISDKVTLELARQYLDVLEDELGESENK